MARFSVQDTFSVRSGRDIFVLAGDVVEGTIKVGMSLRYAGEGFHQEFPVVGVEFVDNLRQRIFRVGLCLPLASVEAAGLDNPGAWVGSEFECA